MSGNAGLPGSAGAWSGGQASVRAYCVLAPNAGPMTLDGTNTWIVHEPGSQTAGIIDPGPDNPEHWEAVADELDRREARAGLILLTHGHSDHSAGARMFAENAGCEVRALDPRHRLGNEGLAGGDAFDFGGTELRVINTPGHSSDSLSFHLAADGALLTGDTILGRGTTVVAYPDGQLGDYLDSLHRLRDLAADTGLSTVLPGHGPILDSPSAIIDAYLLHREQRLGEVRSARDAILAQPGMRERLAEAEAAGAASLDALGLPEPILDPSQLAETLTPGERSEAVNAVGLAQLIVERVYADVPRIVWPAALLSVRAQLSYLAATD